jgi:hydrogenase maturation factor
VADVSGVGIELEAGAYAQVRIHATLEDVTVDEAVERLSGMAGLRYAESADSGYVIMAEGPE